MTKKYNVAVIGATGTVGSQVTYYLSERQFPVSKLLPVSSEDSLGKKISFGDDELDVLMISEIDFKDVDIAFFCASSEVSAKYAKLAAEAGAIIIDKSPLFRMDKDASLIVPEVNWQELQELKSNDKKGKIIASPNCCAIPLSVALKPLDNVAKIKRIVVSTYQSVSGAGKQAMDELYKQTKGKYANEVTNPEFFSEQIAFNLIPQIGDFNDQGATDEEVKIEQELTRLLGNHISVSVTSVRLPIFVSHGMSVNVEFSKDITHNEAEEILREADGIMVHSHHNEIQYITPIEATGEDEVFVSRVRQDSSRQNTINMWVITDNLRKGAALNAVQIAEEIIR